jgi:hypothetical protein
LISVETISTGNEIQPQSTFLKSYHFYGLRRLFSALNEEGRGCIRKLLPI